MRESEREREREREIMIRGRGQREIDLSPSSSQLSSMCLGRAREKHGVLAITAGKGDIIRLVPPLVLTDEDIAWAADGINKAIVEVLGA